MSGLFNIEGLSFHYGDKPVISGLSTGFDAGVFYGIVGPNGCGKTTFLDLLVRHCRPSTGEISFRGKSLSAFPKKQLAREMALVPQNFYINFPFTAREVVMMGRYPHIPRFSAPSARDEEIVRDVMARAGVSQFENRHITELSGGERQRVVFARALAQDPVVLLLDEATSNLDIHHSLHLLNIAAEGVRKDGKTVIAVMQDINLAAAFCHRLVFMKEGRIFSSGESDHVLNGEALRSVFNVDAKVYFEPYCESKQVVFRR